MTQENWNSAWTCFPPAIFVCQGFHHQEDVELNVQLHCSMYLNAFPSFLYLTETASDVLNTLLLNQRRLFGRFLMDSDFCLNKKGFKVMNKPKIPTSNRRSFSMERNVCSGSEVGCHDQYFWMSPSRLKRRRPGIWSTSTSYP